MKRKTGTVTHKRVTLFPNEISEVHKFNLTPNGTKLLLGLAQCIDHTEQLFPEYYFDTEKLAEFFGITHRTDKRQVIRDAFHDIGENPLMISSKDAKKWLMMPWMSAEYDEENSNYVKVQFDEKVKPYLIKLNGYVKLRGSNYINLTSQNAMQLYPLMKTIQMKYYGKREISIVRLMELTNTDNKKTHSAYHNENNGVGNFLSRVLGVSGVRGSVELNVINLKDKSGYLYTSAIKQINELTDINVRCERVKDSGKTVGVCFYVESKNKKLDVPTPSVQKNQNSGKLPHAIPMSQVHQTAKEAGMTAAEMLRITKRTISKCGRFALKANDEWVDNAKQQTLFDKAVDDF